MKSHSLILCTLLLTQILILFGGIPGSAQTYIFGRATLQAQARPTAVASADLNADGAIDLLTTNSGSNTVSVFKNQRNGTFATSPAVITGKSPVALVVGDFNGDSKPDLAVVNQGDNSVSVFVGNGDTTFSPTSTIVVGTSPVSIVAADFNGDQKTDLAVANQSDNTVSILLGNGNGTFTRGTDVLTAAGPITLVSTDSNEDGKSDLIVLAGTSVTPFLGHGDGTFSPQAALTVPPAPSALVTADFNGDSKPDLAVANDAGSTSVFIFIGNGDGTFTLTSTLIGTGVQALGLAADDLNGDGKLDVVLSSKGCSTTCFKAGDLTIFLGSGDGTFTLKQTFGNNEARQIVTADVNNDGKADLIGSYTLYNELALFIGQGNGDLLSMTGYPVGQFPFDIGSADFNRDGAADIAVLNANSESVSILLNNHDGTFRSAGQFGVQGVASKETLADFNGDGVSDIAVSDPPCVSVLLAKGDGSFQPAVCYNVGFANVVLTGDFNGDGVLDIIESNFNGAMIGVLPGKGDGTFGSPVFSPTSPGQPLGFAVGDLDNDGILDAVVAYNFSTQIDVFRGNGNGTFTLVQTYQGGGNNQTVRIDDLNGDGKADVIVANNSFPGQLLIFDGNGDGTLQKPRIRNLNNSTIDVEPVDWDRNGSLDLAAAGGSFSVIPGAGNGSFGNENDFEFGLFDELTINDFLGFGGSDVALVDGSINSAIVMLNQPVIALTSSSLVFGNQKVGTQSQPIALHISNSGTVPIPISGISSAGDFTQTNNCGSSIAIRGACTVNVTFAPTQTGKRTGTLTINDKVPGSPQIVLLSGTGT